MSDKPKAGDKSKTVKKVFLDEKKYLVITLFVVVILFISIIVGVFSKAETTDQIFCGDGTEYNSCSLTKPYFCSENGNLIDLASSCGCPDGFNQEGNFCTVDYERAKDISLDYVVRGRNYSSHFIVYEEFANYVSEIPRSIHYSSSEDSSRADFKKKAIGDPEQRDMLMPLVIKIQNMTSDKEDQVRIAISIVQNIPFGYSNKTIQFGEYNLTHSRYPYEVLYDEHGICGEKTDLLAFLLKELGYGVGFFYYPQENHEAIGIKCPSRESLLDTGYCFVETTGSSILTDNEIYFSNIGQLKSTPEFYLISDGEELSRGMYEYEDADMLMKIRYFIIENGYLWPSKKKMYDDLDAKYGLAEIYYGG